MTQVALDVFKKATDAANRVLPSRTTLPVLQHLLLDGQDGTITITGTNLEGTLVARVPAQIDAPFRVTVPGKLLGEILSKFGGSESVALSFDGAATTLRCGRAKTTLRGMPPDEFPRPTEFTADLSVTLSGKALKEALGQVLFAAAQDETRPVLAGVHFAFGDGRVKLSAADGFRLSLTDMTIDEGGDTAHEFVLPAKAAAEVARLASDGEGVALIASRNVARFVCGDATLYSRLIEGTFPNVAAIIPRNPPRVVIVESAALARAVSLASTVAKEAGNPIVRLSIGADDQGPQLTVSAQAESGESSQEIAVDLTGETTPLTIAFNGKYLADALNATPGARVRLSASQASAPGTIRPAEVEAPIHVIMPMHLNQR